ncbi:MAG: RNA methyltransferase [Lachnospiraceae bacterium]
MITSTDNKQMKNLMLLNHKAKARKQQGVFVAEGLKMFLEAPSERIEGVYVSDTFIQKEENKNYLMHQNYEVVSDRVFLTACDTLTPQGILTVVKQKEYTLSDMFFDNGSGCILILDEIQDPGNLGTMIRTGEGAGITGVIMNQTTVDPYNPKTIRATMGSIYRVPHLITGNLEDVIGQLKERKITIFAAHLNGTCNYDEVDLSHGTGFLIGNEGNGLGEEIVEQADVLIKIPMEGRVESLNAAIAASLLMYEAKRQRKNKDR